MRRELKDVLHRHFCELVALENDLDEYEVDPALITRFMTALNEPVNPKKAKYAKAVSRILKLTQGEQPSLYFAIEYRDMESLLASEAFREVVALKADASEPRRLQTWQTLRALARLAYQVEGAELPRVPSRGEIEANIQQFRAMKRAKNGAAQGGTSGSMQRAFFEKLLEAASVLPPSAASAMRERLHAIPTQETRRSARSGRATCTRIAARRSAEARSSSTS